MPPSLSKLFAEMTDLDMLQEVLRIAESHDDPQARLDAIALDISEYLRWKQISNLLKVEQSETI